MQPRRNNRGLRGTVRAGLHDRRIDEVELGDVDTGLGRERLGQARFISRKHFFGCAHQRKFFADGSVSTPFAMSATVNAVISTPRCPRQLIFQFPERQRRPLGGRTDFT